MHAMEWVSERERTFNKFICVSATIVKIISIDFFVIINLISRVIDSNCKILIKFKKKEFNVDHMPVYNNVHAILMVH